MSTILKAKLTDADQIYNLLKLVGQEMLEKDNLLHWTKAYPLKRIIEHIDMAEMYVMKNDSKIIGSFVLTEDSSYFKYDKNSFIYLSKLAINPNHQRMGFGKKIMKNVEAVANFLNKKGIRLDVYNQSSKAIAFYQQNDFRIVDEASTFNFKVICMEKKIEKSKRLVILGAGFLQKFVILEAQKMGVFVLSVDGNEESLGFEYADISIVADISNSKEVECSLSQYDFDGVICPATDYGVVASATLAKSRNLIGNEIMTAITVKNKSLVRKCFVDNKVDDMKSFFLIEDNGKPDMTIEEYPLIVKPSDGSGSKGVYKVLNADELRDSIVKAKKYSKANSITIEPFIAGIEYGVESIVIKNQATILLIMKKTMHAKALAEIGHCSDSGLSEQMITKVDRYVKKAIKYLGISTGAVNMDILIRGTEVFIIDVGLRMGGNLIGSHIVPLSTGFNYIENLIRLSLKMPTDLSSLAEVNNKKIVITRILNFNPGLITKLDFEEKEILEDVKSEYSEIYFNKRTGDKIREYKNNLDGCGYLVFSDIDKEKIYQDICKTECSLEEGIVRSNDI